MADFLVKVIPLPQPRPSSLQYQPENPFQVEIQMVEATETVKLGIERMKEQLNYILEPLTQFYGWLEESNKININDFGISVLMILGLSGLVTLLILGITKLFKL